MIGGPEDYLFGEETGLLEVIEGNDALPRWLPPYLHGLFATTPQEGWSATSRQVEDAERVGSNPTLANNVETLANIIPILRHGAAEYVKRGTSGSTWTRLFCLSGSVNNPGVYEVELGTTLRELIDLAGGVTQGRSIQAILLGGAAGMFVGPDMLDLKLTH